MASDQRRFTNCPVCTFTINGVIVNVDGTGVALCSRRCPIANAAALRDEFAANARAPVETCVECSATYDPGQYCEEAQAEMAAAHACFGCTFWLDVVRERARHVVIDGTAYHPAPDRQESYWSLGYGGRTFVIERLADGSRFTNSNLWCRGTVPDHFRGRLPDDARFVLDREADRG